MQEEYHMGTFATTHAISYTGGRFVPPVQLTGFTITDGDTDTTFETGDTFFESGAGLTYQYEGTALVDGVDWPVFSFVGFPGTLAIFLDQVPVTVPATLSLNAGDTFTGACFAAGTEIATPDGARPVEELGIGHAILTEDGREVPVKWIGRQTVSTRFGPAERLMPVRVLAGALGDGLPVRDLVLTADHALLIDGLLINSGAMVNGTSIINVPLSEMGKSYTVYHVETEDHDIILAEGAPAETFIDYVGRQAFDNYAEYVALYGNDRTIPELPQIRISASRLVPPAIRARLDRCNAA
jgi:hypothetical protein